MIYLLIVFLLYLLNRQLLGRNIKWRHPVAEVVSTQAKQFIQHVCKFRIAFNSKTYRCLIIIIFFFFYFLSKHTDHIFHLELNIFTTDYFYVIGQFDFLIYICCNKNLFFR